MRGRRLFVGFGLLVALLASPETVFGGAMEEESQQERKQVDTRLRKSVNNLMSPGKEFVKLKLKH